MRKILFVNQPSYHASRFYINPISWVLRLYHQVRGQSRDNWSWLEPLVIRPGQKELEAEIVEQIVSCQPDILALSVYTWNRDLLYAIADTIKQRCPEIMIVAGGPDVDGYHDHENFYQQYPYIDWCVFSAGEASFSRLLDYLDGHSVELTNTSGRNGIVSKHEVFMDNEFMKGSPLLSFAGEIKQHIDNVAKKFSSQGYHPVYVWETVKGCPYKCSFCDWTNSGIGNKVRFWGKNAPVTEPIWKQELRLLFAWQLQEVYWTNPNMGQTEEDEEIIDFWCKLKDQYPQGPTIPRPNMTKNQKDRGFRLFTKMVKHGVMNRVAFALQDLDTTVLANIDRPEIPWSEHRRLITNFIADVQDSVEPDNFWIIGELIWGLPGQTLDTWLATTEEVFDVGLIPQWNWFQILPFSPAGKREYQQQYKISVERLFLGGHWGDYCTGTYSLTKKDWMIGIIAGVVLEVLRSIDHNWARQNAKVVLEYVINAHWIDDVYSNLEQRKEITIAVENKRIPFGQWINQNKHLIATDLNITNQQVSLV